MPSPRAVLSLSAGALTSALGLILAAIIPAAASPAGTGAAPTLTVTRPALPAGTTTPVLGTHFPAKSTAHLSLDGRPVGDTRVGASGAFSYRLRLPRGTRPGPHPLTVTDDGVHASAELIERVDWPRQNFSVQGDAVNPYETILNQGTVAGLHLVRTEEEADGPGVLVDHIWFQTLSGDLSAIDTATGRILWEDADVYAYGTPTVAPGLGLVLVGLDDGLAAYDISTGRHIWSAGDVGYSPIVVNGNVYVPSNSSIIRLNPATGAAIWTADLGPIGAPAGSSPSYDAGLLFVNGSAGTGAIDAVTGAVVWFASASGGCMSGSPVVADGQVFVECADSSENTALDSLRAYGESSGALTWETRVQTGPGFAAAPTVAGGLVLVPVGSVGVKAYDEGSGNLTWSLPDIGIDPHAAPTVADGLVYVSDADGKLLVLASSSGHIVLTLPKIGEVAQTPIIADGILYAETGVGLKLLKVPVGKGGEPPARPRT